MHRTDRLHLLKIAWLGIAILVLSVAGRAFWQGPVPKTRPNIILIIADDLGAEDSGPYGSKAVRTPNLDRMARDGMRFTRAFNTCSSCSPSRSSIITGRYPHSTGAAQLHMPLPGDQVTFVEKLRNSGYWTAAAGKWHLGPYVMGRFDVVHEDRKAAPDSTSDGSGCRYWLPTLQERPRDKPFFLWLASHDPHRPYFEGTLAVPHRPEEAEVPPYLPDVPPTRKDLAMYYDEVGRLDAHVGKVLAELERQGVLKQTAIFFITDNGRPFPRCKTSVYDSGIRSPFLVRWPGHVKSGSASTSLISSVDIAPTLLELAGLPPELTFQGKSPARLLTDPSASIRDQVFAEHNWHDFSACERSVRTARFKYIRNFWPYLPGTPPADAVRSLTFQEMRRLRDAGRLTAEQLTCFIKQRHAEELYDVETDSQELKNLAADPAYDNTLKQLRADLDQWRRETADFEPSPRPPDTFDRETGEPLSKAAKKEVSKKEQANPKP